jgi:hypothetical protein
MLRNVILKDAPAELERARKETILKYCICLALVLSIGVAGCANRTDYSSSSQAPVQTNSVSPHGVSQAQHRQVSMIHFFHPRRGQAATQRPGTTVGTSRG